MINKLTINGMTIEYPSQMTVAISGANIRLLPQDDIAIEPANAPEPEPPAPPLSSVPAAPVKPKRPAIKSSSSSKSKVSTPVAKAPLQVLPADWKDIVITTLRQNDGTAYARRLSLRVFKGVAKISYSQATHLRRELRAMVDRGELRALGSNNAQAPQMLYGLPETDESVHTQVVVNG